MYQKTPLTLATVLLAVASLSAQSPTPIPAPKPEKVMLGANNQESTYVWIEGERADTSTMQRHGWYNSVRQNELSGKDWLHNFGSDAPAVATYTFEAPEAGDYEFWVRANPTGKAQLSYKIDEGDWQLIDQGDSKQQVNIANDGKPDLRYVAWTKVGTVPLSDGSHEVAFRMDSKNNNHGGLDAFVFSRDPFLPNNQLKPGSKSGLAEDGKWAFEPSPDPLKPGALLDLSYLNEKPAGKNGFIKLSDDGESFVDGAGNPIRFWSGTTYVFRDNATVDEVKRWGEFYAKRGINMVRFHGNLSGQGKNFDQVNEQQLDEAMKLVAGMKEAGIYTTISPYWGSHTKVPQGWDGPDPDHDNMTGLVFFDPKTQVAYKNWLKELFTRENPYTGIPLKDDPAFAIFQIQNEDSLLFWTEQRIKGEARELLGKQFAEFLKEKYGSLEAAQQAWDGDSMKEDDFANGVVGLYTVWHFTQEAKGGKQKRLADQLEFYGRTMHEFNTMIADYIRNDLGAPQLINAGNWKTADDVLLNDVERWSYSANDIMGVNKYYGVLHKGEGSGHSIRKDHTYDGVSALKAPLRMPTNLKLPVGHPMLIPESQWVPPNPYQVEGPLAVAAYSSLTGVDSFYWFTIGRGFDSTFGKWSTSTPVQLGMFPGASLLFRNHYLEEGKPVVHERRSLQNLWDRTSTLIAESPGFDPNRDAGDLPAESSVKGGVDPRAFLVGPVKVSYGEDPSKSEVADLSPYIDDASGTVRSNTGQITLNSDKGILSVNAPKAQAVAGFLSEAPPAELDDVTIDSKNDYGGIYVVSLDGKDLKDSGNVLVQAATTMRPYGFKDEPVDIETDDGVRKGRKITDLGSSPMNLEVNQTRIELRNPRVNNAYVLDANGYAVEELALEKSDEGISFQFPAEALYVVIRED